MWWIHAAIHVARAISEQNKRTAASTPSLGRHAPLRVARSEREIFCDAKWERMEGAREIRLGLHGGAVFLVLCDPAPDAVDGMSDAVIEARDAAKGAAFLEAIARWLDVELPPRPRGAGGPAPFALRWSRWGEVDGVERIHLSFRWKDRAADIALHARTDAHLVKFVEVSSASRQHLVAILRTALRDGAPT